FLHYANKLHIPVAVINGRMSPRSFRRYSMLSGISRWLFRQVDLFAVQTETYADCYRKLGVDPECIHVTGSVKYDGVAADRNNPRTRELARLFGVTKEDLVWIAGSTQAPEEEIVLDIYRQAKSKHPNLRL